MMPCESTSDFGDVCAVEGEHWMHSTEPDSEGMVLAWGQKPEDWIERPCPAGCGFVAGCSPDAIVTVVHKADGFHLVIEPDGTEHEIRIVIEQPEEAAMTEQELVDYTLDPHYHVTTLVNGRVIGRPELPIPNPFSRTSVQITRGDLLRALFSRRRLNVVVDIGGDWDAMKHVMTPRPIQVAPPAPVGDERLIRLIGDAVE